ncbi:MAG: universal stress protein [Deltaproteobacteria bacterium]|nr:universal stress protein [Deltaproteobacteria bacterium]
MAEDKGKPIVVAVDGSPPSWDAMETAISLARLMGRPIDVLHVVQLVKAGYFAFIDRHLQEEHQAQAQKILSEAVERGKKAGVEVRPHLSQSEKGSSEGIIDYLTKAGPVKFLVMGTHGHGFMARHLLGSVTERVLREVTHQGLPVPLLIVPAGTTPE